MTINYNDMKNARIVDDYAQQNQTGTAAPQPNDNTKVSTNPLPQTNHFASNSYFARYKLECDETYKQLITELETHIGSNKYTHLQQASTEFHAILQLHNSQEAFDRIYALLVQLNANTSQNQQLYILRKACWQLQAQLKLMLVVQDWAGKTFENRKDALDYFHNAIRNDQDFLNHAHPKTTNLANRFLLDAKGWLEIKELMYQYQQLESSVGIKRFISDKERKKWLEQRHQCQDKIKALAKTLQLSDSAIRELTQIELGNTEKPFSLDWTVKYSKEIKSSYLNSDLTISDEGLQHIESLLSEALNPYSMEASLPRKIERCDLMLLAHYLGRDNMQKFAQIYGLKGDGTFEHPFHMDNVRAILIGMAANRNPATESETIKNLLDEVAEKNCDEIISLGYSPRMMGAFLNRSQNALPENADETMRTRMGEQNFRRWLRQYSYGAIASANENYAAPSLFSGSPMFLVYLAAISALAHTQINNDPARSYMNDLAALMTQRTLKPAAKKINIPVAKEAVNKILADLKSCKTYKDFCALYPMFSERNAHLKERSALQNYFVEREPESNIIPRQLEEYIANKVDAIDRLSRGMKLSFDNAYVYTDGKDSFTHDLSDHNSRPMKFHSKNILNAADSGLGISIYTPIAEEKIFDKTIPLIIMFPGTHNQLGILRDMETRSPGKSQWTNPEYKKQILSALNDEIGRLRKHYPEDYKISIELMGHSLGGSDVLHMELLIMEAMGQNLNQDNPQAIQNYREKIESIFTKKDLTELNTKDLSPRRQEQLLYKKTTQEQLLLGLKTALGKEPRSYNTLTDNSLFHKDDDRGINQSLRSHIHPGNIISVSSFCNRGSGMCREDAYAECALMGLLTEDKEFTINQDTLNIEGDPLRLSGTGMFYGAAFVDPTLAPFQKMDTQNPKTNLKVNDVQVRTGLGTHKGGFINAFGENNLAPALAHTSKAFGGNPYTGSIGFRDAMDVEENAEYRKQVTGRWLTAENPLMRGFKWSVYTLLLYVLRIPAEILIRHPILMGIPTAFSYASGSSAYDASYKGLTQQVLTQRKKINTIKQEFNISVRESKHQEKYIDATKFDNHFLLSVKQEQIEKLDMQHVQSALIDKYPYNIMEHLTPWKKLSKENGLNIHEHLQHQLVKAQHYLYSWQERVKQLEKLTNSENTIYAEELNTLEKQIKHHQQLVDLLQGCFHENLLNLEGCKTLLKTRLTNKSQEENYIEERHAKTLSLETKAMMPLIMAIQKQELEQAPANEIKVKQGSLKQSINEYRSYLIQEDLHSQAVMSSQWLQKNSMDTKYHSKAGEITAAGFKHLEVLFNRAHGLQIDNGYLSKQDMVLLAHFFGRRTMKRVMDRYSLTGDGSDLHEFNIDNLRMLLIGAAALHKPEYMYGVSEEHRKKLDEVHHRTINTLSDPDKKVGAIKRIWDNLSNYEQNDLARTITEDPLKPLRGIGRGFNRFFFFVLNLTFRAINSLGFSTLMRTPMTGETEPLTMVTGASFFRILVEMLTPDNPSLTNFAQDLKMLYVQKIAARNAPMQMSQSDEEKLEQSQSVADTIFNYLNEEATDVVEFLKTYPMFQLDRNVFETYLTQGNNKPEVMELINQRVQQINKWGRAELISLHASYYVGSNNQGTKVVLDQQGQPGECYVKTISDTGIPNFSFNCLWPKETPIENQPINLMIVIPENIDTADIHAVFAPFTRMAALFRAGHQTLEQGANSEADRWADRVHTYTFNMPSQNINTHWFHNKERRSDARLKIIKAINDQIDQIEQRHGSDAKINIELFGRGIAASHCHQLELYILEVLAARKAKKEQNTDAILAQFNKDPNGHSAQLIDGFNRGIKEKHIHDAVDVTKFSKIVGINSYAFNSVGEPSASAKKRAALIAYLACKENKQQNSPGFQVEHNTSNVEGDPSAYLGEDNADGYIDTNSEAFKDKGIKITHATTASGRELRDHNWLFNSVLKGKFSTEDLSAAFGRFLGPGRYQSNTTIVSENNPALRKIINEQTGHKNVNNFYSEQRAGIGYALRSCMIKLVFYPASKIEQMLKWTFYHPITLIIGKIARDGVYNQILSSDADADANAQKTLENAREHLEDVENSMHLNDKILLP